MTTQPHSSFWLDKELFDTDMSDNATSLHRVMRLSAIRRAVANFVTILTNRDDIEVAFSSGAASYTDGAKVVIAADDNPDNFDKMVGLALHEAAHVKLTDFNFSRMVQTEVISVLKRNQHPARWGTYTPYARPMLSVLPLLLHPSVNEVLERITDNAYFTVAQRMIGDIHKIMNILEDRRIDRWVYTHAGGYRPYYDALYRFYFFTDENERNLRWNPAWRELTIANYIDRILLVFHPAARADAMPGLDVIYRQIDLDTIDRLSEPPYKQKGELAYRKLPKLWKEANILYGMILRYVAAAELEKRGDSQAPMSDFLDGVTIEDVLEATNHTDLPNLDIPVGQMVPVPVEAPELTKQGKPKPIKFNANKAAKQMAEARKFTEGGVKKKKATAKEIEAASALEKAQADIVDIKGHGIPGGSCLVTRKMSESLFSEPWFPFCDKSLGWSPASDNHRRKIAQVSIAAGRRMGMILVQRLQVRNDPVYTKHTRLPTGGLDRRLLAQLGMDIESVFQKTRVDTHKPVMLHLTLDASGSMYGEKWDKVRTVAVALAYVGSKMRNIDTVISMRGGHDRDMPIVSIVYDSRRDRFEQFIKWMAILYPRGSTPEGLCFTATMELITECAATHDVYFINFSDGSPTFTLDTRGFGAKGRPKRKRYAMDGDTVGYFGELAIRHTQHTVQTMRAAGVKVLAYYIESSPGRYGYANNGEWNAFQRMYGQDSVRVNVTNATEVLRTVNKLLLTR